VLPAFTIDPGVSGYTALWQAYDFLADRPRMLTDATLHNTAPQASETSDYTFGTDHPLRAIELRSVPYPVSEAQAFGNAAYGTDRDHTQLPLGIGGIERIRDLTSTTGAAAA
jgi:hypothetical protein